jgi:hypothetical protein
MSSSINKTHVTVSVLECCHLSTRPELHLPSPNQFIPTDLALRKEEAESDGQEGLPKDGAKHVAAGQPLSNGLSAATAAPPVLALHHSSGNAAADVVLAVGSLGSSADSKAAGIVAAAVGVSEGSGAEGGPRVVASCPGLLRVWHRLELRFSAPKAVLYLDVQVSRWVSGSGVSLEFWVRLFQDSMLAENCDDLRGQFIICGWASHAPQSSGMDAVSLPKTSKQGYGFSDQHQLGHGHGLVFRHAGSHAPRVAWPQLRCTMLESMLCVKLFLHLRP